MQQTLRYRVAITVPLVVTAIAILAVSGLADASGTPSQATATSEPLAPADLFVRLHEQAREESLQAASLPPSSDHVAAGAIGAALATGVATLVYHLHARRSERVPAAQKEFMQTLLDSIEQEEVEAVVEVPPAGLPGILVFGQDAVDRGSYEEALGWFDCAVRLDPDAQQVHLCRGLCLAELGRGDEALGAFATAVDLDPADGLARFHLAKAHGVLGHERDALAALAPLVKAMPELADSAFTDPAFSGLRDHPSFLALVGRL